MIGDRTHRRCRNGYRAVWEFTSMEEETAEPFRQLAEKMVEPTQKQKRWL